MRHIHIASHTQHIHRQSNMRKKKYSTQRKTKKKRIDQIQRKEKEKEEYTRQEKSQ